MIKELKIANKIIKYELTRKRVKNINVRIKPDGMVYVSASKTVPLSTIEGFLLEKADVIKYDYQLLDDAYWLLNSNGYKIIRL